MSNKTKGILSVLFSGFLFHIAIKPYVYFLRCLGLGVATGLLIVGGAMVLVHYIDKEIERNHD